MSENKLNTDRFFTVELSDNTQPIFTAGRNKEWVSWGLNNDYPEYIIDLYNREPSHGAIVKGKASYVYGKGLTVNKEQTGSVLELAKVTSWLDKANRYESWNDVYEKTSKYFELFNGWAWQITWNQNGSRIAEVFCLELSKLRRSKDGKQVIYCDKWINDDGKVNQYPEKDSSYKCYPVFNPNIRTGTQIMYFRLDVPTTQKYGDLYPTPDYSGCIADTETSIEIIAFRYHLLKNGMFSQGLMTLFEGEPDAQAKKKIKENFTYSHTGTKRTGKIIFYFANKADEKPDYQSLSAPDLDKMFDQMGKDIKQNIFTSHRADPVLFGVMTEGSLSDTGGDGVLKKWDKFLRTYVEGRQEIILREIKALGQINGVDTSSIEVEQTSPVGVELPEPQVLLQIFDKADVQKAYAKKYGIEITNPVVAVPVSSPESQPMAEVNEHLKNITGKQWIHIKRLIREVTNGKTPREVASMMLKNSYGLTEQDIEILLKTPESQFSKFELSMEEKVLSVLSDPEFGISQEYIEVLEFTGEKFAFADRKVKKDDEYYYYTGPLDEKTRAFCKTILTLDKVFSIEEINTLSTLTGYDVFEYQPGPIKPNGGPGGPECRHGWIRFRGKFVLTPAPTTSQINRIASKSIFN